MWVRMSESGETNEGTSGLPTFREAMRYWVRLGFLSFGGPAGQIAMMHRDLVEKRKWLSEGHFLHALNFCMLLPGPEAQQLATYLGWRLHGWRGGLAAGGMFVLPSALILFGLSWLYMVGGQSGWVAGIFHGLIPAVIAVIAAATLRMGMKTLRSASLWGLAVAAFVAIYFGGVSFLLIVLVAALVGGIGHRFAKGQFPEAKGHGKGGDEGFVRLPDATRGTWKRAILVTVTCVTLWVIPIIAFGVWLGWQSVPVAQGLFFSKAALVTFGGAYAVLPYVAQQAVEHHGWLTSTQMMAGMALAETTPGPLVIVLQFVGFVGGWQNPGGFHPLLAATIGAGITTWVTFLPCFLFVFLGAPYVERLRDMPRIGASLTAITASVVGVILNMGVKFSEHALWKEGEGFDVMTAIIAVAAFLAMWRFKVSLLVVLGVCGGLGLLMVLI